MTLEIKSNQQRSPLDQLEKRIDIQPILAQEVRSFCEDRFTSEERGSQLLHHSDGPVVIWIAAIEIGDQWPGITDGDHDRPNFRRLLVAAFGEPERLPARSPASAWND